MDARDRTAAIQKLVKGSIKAAEMLHEASEDNAPNALEWFRVGFTLLGFVEKLAVNEIKLQVVLKTLCEEAERLASKGYSSKLYTIWHAMAKQVDEVIVKDDKKCII